MTQAASLQKPLSAPPAGGLAAWLALADQAARELETTAVERDRDGADPVAEVDLLRRLGLLTLSIPAKFGGGGARASELLKILRRIAEADMSLAQILSYHYFGARIGLEGENAALREKRLDGFLNKGWFHAGIAQAAYEPLISARNDGEGFRLDGAKPFTSGAAVADTLQVWARFAPGAQVDGRDVSGFIGQFLIENPTPGLSFDGDWDAIGQRQTVSGGAKLERVRAARADLVAAYPEATAHPPSATAFVPVIHISFAELYVGAARGALAAAKRYIHEQSRPWIDSGKARAAEDPLIVERFGEISARLAAAEALADAAGAKADEALALGAALTEEGRGELAVIAYQAKIVAHETALEATSRIFELMGARASARRYGFDRFWRNVRTHTLHDPIHYKLLEVGEWALNDRFPIPGYYR